MSNKKNIWSEDQEKKLYSLHQSIGNHWADIAAQLGSKDQNSIKNKFYSTLRKGVRKINKYLFEIKKKSNPQKYKSIKPIQEIFISKLMAVFDQNYEEKYQVKPRAIQLVSSIEQKLIGIARSEEEYETVEDKSYETEQQLFGSIMEFNKNCKKRKGKKKDSEKKISMQEESIEQSEIIDGNKQQEKSPSNIGIVVKPPCQENKNKAQQITSSFLNTMQKKESTQTVVRLGNFSNLANEFIKTYSRYQAQESPFFQSTNIAHSTHSVQSGQNEQNFLFDSKKQRKQVGYLTEVSPYPNDTSSPYSFGNIMKFKNITGSNMFQDKISNVSGEILENSTQFGNYTNPNSKQNKFGEILFKSAEIKLEINQQNTNFNKVQGQIYRSCIIRKQDSETQKNFVNFAKQYAFQPHMGAQSENKKN